MRPLVIGHRGAPGYFPEHSAQSYLQAIALGADAVETDLVMSRDGALIVRHDLELSRTTDVATRPEFADRRHSLQVNGTAQHGWFTHDFTLAELRTLNAPTPGFGILTLDELLLLLAEAPRQVGLHVEVKIPSYFSQMGLPVTRTLLDTLYDHGRDEPAHVHGGPATWIQSFDGGFLEHLGRRTALPLMRLIEAPAHLESIAEYADAVGPRVDLVLDPDPTGLVRSAHRAGLEVHCWTLGNSVAQTRAVFNEGVDGVFSDFPDLAVRARQMAQIPAA